MALGGSVHFKTMQEWAFQSAASRLRITDIEQHLLDKGDDLDINANGAVDIAHFLHVLGLFGDVDSDGDGVCCQLLRHQLTLGCVSPGLDVVGVCGGACAMMKMAMRRDDWSAFTYHGKDYATVQIGRGAGLQRTYAENYRNGDLIPAGLSDEEWSTTTSGAMAVYGEGSSSCNTDSPDGDACDPRVGSG